MNHPHAGMLRVAAVALLAAALGILLLRGLTGPAARAWLSEP